MTLLDRINKGAAYRVDSGGLSGGTGDSPYARDRRIYDGYDPAVAPQRTGARLAQRINPVTVGRGGVRKEYEGGL